MKNDYAPALEMGQDRPCKCAPDTLQLSYKRNRPCQAMPDQHTPVKAIQQIILYGV